ncbi:hypothetical protein [Sphingobium vermicomposti]|uniref:Acyl-coenzyme A thioesterase PaaI-like protein n=1 Tax=Sphingobium vermicomposti TaxID=529005 RepID=A0A846MHW0_9SPHN|nr:hypothetical protein [Sphingobium vermicomposti]NIJ17946.1 acyl-coenzyme A thioesterase PaaI-like protein [Sphingobium vermicomposti]
MSGAPDALIAERQAAIVASFARQGVLLGMGGRLVSIEVGRWTLELPFGEAVAQQHGFFAGGAIGVLADVVGVVSARLLPTVSGR